MVASAGGPCNCASASVRFRLFLGWAMAGRNVAEVRVPRPRQHAGDSLPAPPIGVTSEIVRVAPLAQMDRAQDS